VDALTTMGVRLHHSSKLVGLLHDVQQSEPQTRKPRGLWWGLGTGWLDHVAAHPVDRSLRRFQRRPCVQEVLLRPGANILRLSNVDEIAAFTATFGRPVPFTERAQAPRDRCIAWSEVARGFDGIEIVDLCIGRRPRLEWLDVDWCVPSGCVWNATAISELKRISGGA
jgi:hypothetical protein